MTENQLTAMKKGYMQVMMVAHTAEEGRTLLGALETGVDGVVLNTDDVGEVCMSPSVGCCVVTVTVVFFYPVLI